MDEIVVTHVPNALIPVLPTTVTSFRLSVHCARCRCSFKMAAPVGRWWKFISCSLRFISD